ncbi:MAG: secretin N-terminal domain-containing protein [Armatimonadota bacterium]
MRLLTLGLASLSLLFVAPARAENRTEAIPFRFTSAAEVERILESGGGGLSFGSIAEGASQEEYELLPADLLPSVPPAGRGREGARSLVPAGITAWSVDSRANQLWVTGTPEAIGKLKELTELLDHPVQRVRITIQAVRPGPEMLQAAEKEPQTFGAEKLRILTLTPAERRALQAAPPIASLPAENNRIFRLRVPVKKDAPAGNFSLLPRINGDQSVTLIVAGRRVGEDRSAWAAIFLRRLPAGGSLLLLGEALAEPLLITLEPMPEEK